MTDVTMVEEFLAGAEVHPAVFALRPDYRAMLIAVDGLVPGPSDALSDRLLEAAEVAAVEALRNQPVDQLAPWRYGGRRIGRSAPSLSEPATASRRSCVAWSPDSPA